MKTSETSKKDLYFSAIFIEIKLKLKDSRTSTKNILENFGTN